MSKIAIKAENISKQYRLGEIGTGTISHDLNRWWHKVRGKEDPFLKIGKINDRSQKGESDYVWSLKDINFEINQGDAVGIIGRNGAGKSTLLKLLSKVTKPTTGQFKVNGRIASLLEVGTGFHPEMTGRENIYLNGAILGMRRSEITRKFDEIVDFSGIDRYIDTPVKRYSSGMYVRLAFAVAAHLESEILIVDEVLAVGDAEFQKKCLGKMGDVINEDGRTVLFVSHNLNMVSNLCSKSILLDKGIIKEFNSTEKIILKYLKNDDQVKLSDFRIRGGKSIEILKVNLNEKSNLAEYNDEFNLKFTVKSYLNVNIENLKFTVGINDFKDQQVCAFFSDLNSFNLNPKQEKEINVILKLNTFLMPGKYKIGFSLIVGSQFSFYETYDLIYGFNLEIIPSNKFENFNANKWNQGWGSILMDMKMFENNS